MADFTKKNKTSNDYRVITDQIRDGRLKNLYLLHGREMYLMYQYRNMLLKAFKASPEEDTMNYAEYNGPDSNIREITELADTMPFFADYRTIVISDSGFFKNSPSELTDYIKDSLPDSTRIIFVEGEKVKKDNSSRNESSVVSKTSSLYKVIKEKGTVAEFTELDEETTKKWVTTKLINPEGKRIRNSTLDLFVRKTGTDMGNIKNETEKLISYVGDREEITDADVNEIVTVRLKDRVFDMIDSITLRQNTKALELYYDMLAMKIAPRVIISNMINHYNGMLQVKELRMKGYQPDSIVTKMGLNTKDLWKIRKYEQQAAKYSLDELMDILRECADTDERIKSGLVSEQIATEMLIVRFSTK